MFARALLVLMLCILVPRISSSRPINEGRSLRKVHQLDASGRNELPRFDDSPMFRSADSGTTFYGGTYWAADSMRWEAYENQLWTFDSGVGSSIVPTGGPQNLSAPTSAWVNPFKQPGLHASMEGWIGFDNGYGPTPYFRRVGRNDLRWQTTVCVGSSAGLQGDYSFWAGVFPEEAFQLCYAAGQGYGNLWHACIEHAFDYPGGGLTLAFQYKNDTEDGFDYTHVYVDTSSAGDNVEVVSFTGTVSGSGSFPLAGGIELPFVPKPIVIRFCVDSDGAWSDQDGMNPTACGAFALDHVVLTGAIQDTSDFEVDDDGWVLSEPLPGLGGEWSNLASLNDLPPPLAPCSCALAESVLVFPDADGKHNNYQDNLAASPWIDLKSYGKVGAYGKLIATHIYADLPLRNYIFTQFNAQWYPAVCGTTGKLATSPWTSNGFVYYFGGTPQCTSVLPGSLGTQIDFSSFIPPGAEQVRIALGVLSFCRYFANCTQLSNTTPWFDLAGLGVYGDPRTPFIVATENGRAQDNFPMNGGLNSRAPGRVDCNDVQGAGEPEVGTTLGDTLVVQGAIGNAEVYVHFKVRPGAQRDSTRFNAWYMSHAASLIDASFKRARCDTAEYGNGGPILGYWMTAYHEDDPNFLLHGSNDRTTDPLDITPTGGTWRLSHDIFPDNLLTPGSRVDYFFSANNVGSPASMVDPPGAPATVYEMEILPSSMIDDYTFNCVLYVNHARPGARPYIENALQTVLGPGSGNAENTTWDRYDVNAAGTNQASFGRPLQSDYGASVVQALGYSVILWDSGELNAKAVTKEDADVLNPWLTLLNWGHNKLYLSGNGLVYGAVNDAETEPSARHLVEDLAGVTLHAGCSVGSFRSADCPSSGSPRDLTPCVDIVPMPRAEVARPRSPEHVAQGNGCPELRSFDVLKTLTPDFGTNYPDEFYVSPLKSARYTSVATNAGTNSSLDYKIVVDGTSVVYRRDAGTPCEFAEGGTSAITSRLSEVFQYFGLGDGTMCPRRGGISEEIGPLVTRLFAVSPNPLSAGRSGRIRFSLTRDAPARIEVIDLRGRLVTTVFDGPAKAGMNEATWDGRDASGAHVANGVYFYRFRALDQDQSRKIVVMGGSR